MGDAYIIAWPSVHGLKIHSRVSTLSTPDPRAIVLVHGLGVSARYMLPTLEQLAPFHKVYVPELPGFGLSDKPTHTLDIPELADVLAEWLTAVGLSRATFLGNSLGCQVIVDLALRYPALIDGAILVGPTVDSHGRSLIRQLWRGMRDLLHEPWSLWMILAHDYLQSSTWRILQTFRFALQDPVEQKCQRLRIPTLIVRGSYDTIAPMRWVEELVKLIPDARLEIIQCGTHAANYSSPDKLAMATRNFLNTYD